MKKAAIVILASICLFIASSVTYAHTEHPDDLNIFDALENHGSIFIISDSQTGDILHANKAAADFYGYSIEQLESMNLQDLNTLTPEETIQRMQEIVDQERHSFIIDHRLANGEIRTVEINSYPYVSGDKELILGTVNDITERIRLEKQESILIYALAGMVALLLSATFLIFNYSRKLKARNHEISNFNELRKAFIDSYGNMIYLKDENFRYIFLNESLKRFFRKEESVIIGHDDLDISDREFAEQQRKTDMEVLEREAVLVKEFGWEGRIYKATKFPVRLINGKYGVGAYIEDVTEANHNKRMIEKTLQRNQILVDILSRNFESTREQLDYVLNRSLELTESKFGYIYLYNEENQEFTLNSWSKDVMAECTIVEKQTKYRLEKTGLWGEVVRQRKPIVVNNYELPDIMKKGYPEGHVRLTRFISVPVIIDGKIVAVVGFANKEYDYDDNDVYQIIALMNGVWNAKERREALDELAIERSRFFQTLISIGDGVLVVDLDGKVTMLNKAAEKLTGWSTEEAVGRHYKEVFVLSHEDEGCTINDPIEEVLNTNTVQELGNHAVLTSRDGTRYNLEDSAAPIKDDKGSTSGVVLVFRDVTDKNEQRRKIEYLSFHDYLTGLYNRLFFEEELRRLDTERNLPVSVIVGDMNGLKLTNDIFGHDAGDELLKKMAEVLKKVCRADDIIARVGGDEFTILLPKTGNKEAGRIVSRIKNEFSKVKVQAIRGSISMGCYTKVNKDDDILEILKKAEDNMYSAKTLDREKVKTDTINTIIETLHKRRPDEAEHSKNVAQICENIALAMNLPEVEIKKVKQAGFLHDIGKITLSEKVLNKYENFSDEERKEFMQHSITGYRILNSFNDTLDLAELILAHHENWDGSGYPRGLKGEEIPKLARIIAIAESYQIMTRELGDKSMSSKEAVNEIGKQAGKKFDPNIVDVFIDMMHKNNGG